MHFCQVNKCVFPGIVKQDPVLPDDKPLPPPPPRARSAVFEDEEKSKVYTSDKEAPITSDGLVNTWMCIFAVTSCSLGFKNKAVIHFLHIFHLYCPKMVFVFFAIVTSSHFLQMM